MRVDATNVTVTPVAGGPTLAADLSFRSALDQDGADIVVASASNVRFAFVAGSRQVVSLTNGSGLLIVATGGKIAGSLSGTVAVDVPGVSFSGTLALQVNTTGLAVDTLASVGLGAATLVSLSGGAAYVRFAATGAQLQVLGQRLSGDFAVTSSSGTVSLTVANARLDLAGGIASITGASGTFTFGAAGISGNFTGTPSLALPGVQFVVPVGSSVQAQIDTTGATRFVRINGTNVELQVAGQSLKGNFTLEAGAGASGGPVVKIAVVNTSPTTSLLQVGPLTIADGSGQIVVSSAGVAASISIAAAQLSLGITGVSFSGGAIDIAVNTGAAPVTESFLIGTTPTLLTLPGGPYVSVRLLGSTLTLGANSLTGNFVFENAGGVTRLAATNLSASIGGAASLKQAQGAFLVTSSGIAGYATGKADVGAGSSSPRRRRSRFASTRPAGPSTRRSRSAARRSRSSSRPMRSSSRSRRSRSTSATSSRSKAASRTRRSPSGRRARRPSPARASRSSSGAAPRGSATATSTRSRWACCSRTRGSGSSR